MTGGVLALLEAGVDPDFAAFERAEARRASAPPAASAAAPRRPRPTLAALPPAPPAPRAGELAVETAAAHEAAPARCPEADALAHLRAARFGFALAAVLVLYGLWIWQRRRF